MTTIRDARRKLLYELGVFAAFALLTAAMTWPWVKHWRDAASDVGDPYLSAWIFWWDFHQTFHDPLHLFDANIFFPLRTTLAFSEHSYGLALPFFPLFALGVRPLTVQSLATLLGFTLSGYGAFRLARTLTGSTAAGWVAGVAFAFTPIRFVQLPHVMYLSAGWIPLLFEALVLFLRKRSWTRGAWLGCAFFFNGLSCIHWFVLTSVPFALAAALVALREKAELDPATYRRGGFSLGIALLLLVPFLLPYAAVAKRYGFQRSWKETYELSARPVDWLSVSPLNHVWTTLGMPAKGHMLFPGLLMPLLAMAALFLLRRARQPDLPANAYASHRSEALVVGLILAISGFLGSFGLRFPFHRMLWELIPLFRAIRVPARWAMVAHLGLALLAGLGVLCIAEHLPTRARRPMAALVLVALLFELRTAPMGSALIHGAVEADDVTRVLAGTLMSGGIVELPSGGGRGNYEYVLRAADHGKPLVNGVSGFEPAHVIRLEELAAQRPISDTLLDHLESIPVSYLVVHESRLDPRGRSEYHAFVARALSSDRLRFLGRFDGRSRNDLYALAKTEPRAKGAGAPPWEPAPVPEGLGRFREDGSLLGSVDGPAEAETVRGLLVVRGWARMPAGDLDVEIAIDGDARPMSSFRRVSRPDVAHVFPEMGKVGSAGYEATFPFLPGDAGPHELVAIFRSQDGRERHYPVRRFTWEP